MEFAPYASTTFKKFFVFVLLSLCPILNIKESKAFLINFILDKIINHNDPVYWWGWEQTNVGRVNGVKTIADNMFKVTTKNAIYIVQVFDR